MAAAEEPEQDAAAPRIHLPDPSLGDEGERGASDNGAQPARQAALAVPPATRRPRRRRPTATSRCRPPSRPRPRSRSCAEPEVAGETEGEAPKRKKTRRGSRGGRRRKKAPTTASETPSES